MGQSLRFLPGLLSLAKRRQLVVRIAFTFALGYNLTAVGICLQGLMSPLLAAVSHALLAYLPRSFALRS